MIEFVNSSSLTLLSIKSQHQTDEGRCCCCCCWVDDAAPAVETELTESVQCVDPDVVVVIPRPPRVATVARCADWIPSVRTLKAPTAAFASRASGLEPTASEEARVLLRVLQEHHLARRRRRR